MRNVLHRAFVVLHWCWYALLWPVNFALVLLAYFPMAPFMATLAMFTGPVMPVPLRWFSTMNADLDGYIAQDVDGFDKNAKGFKLWWQRIRWTWRNPCNGFQSQVLGVSAVTPEIAFKRELNWLPFGFYIKCWLGWNPNKRGGDYYPYMFQFGPRKRK